MPGSAEPLTVIDSAAMLSASAIGDDESLTGGAMPDPAIA
jgi:hypothetical protein